MKTEFHAGIVIQLVNFEMLIGDAHKRKHAVIQVVHSSRRQATLAASPDKNSSYMLQTFQKQWVLPPKALKLCEMEVVWGSECAHPKHCCGNHEQKTSCAHELERSRVGMCSRSTCLQDVCMMRWVHLLWDGTMLWMQPCRSLPHSMLCGTFIGHARAQPLTGQSCCRLQNAYYGGPGKSPANFVQHQLDLIVVTLYEIASRDDWLLVKVLQNISKALTDLGHHELACAYAIAAMRLTAYAPPVKAAYFAALAARKLPSPAIALGLLRQVRILGTAWLVNDQVSVSWLDGDACHLQWFLKAALAFK